MKIGKMHFIECVCIRGIEIHTADIIKGNRYYYRELLLKAGNNRYYSINEIVFPYHHIADIVITEFNTYFKTIPEFREEQINSILT